jgi:O-antigen ligase
MKINNQKYLYFVLIHIGLGVLFFLFKNISVLYGLLINVFGLLLVLKTQNNNNQVLYITAYIVGSEVVLRMTGGTILYEYAKYSVIFFMLIGMFFSGFSKNSVLYWIFLLLLIPGTIVATFTLDFNADIRKTILFNISGPLCLGISSIYCFRRSITIEQLHNIMLCLLLPIITTLTYMFLYNPSIREVVKNTQSNFATSGGFGPNQVATIIGLGIFLLFVRILFNSKEKKIIIVNILLLLMMTFRGIVTFSRGGIICAVVMIIVLIVILFRVLKRDSKYKLTLMIVFSLIMLSIIWNYSSLQTNGLINKRYANKDVRGKLKSSLLTGREKIIKGELEMFYDSPIFGIGVGKGKENRVISSGGDVIASHNEISRMLSEHGIFGILGLLILFFTPLFLYLNNRQHIYLIPFFIFWILTINHAAMRLAAPAFIYALALLNIYSLDTLKSKTNSI